MDEYFLLYPSLSLSPARGERNYYVALSLVRTNNKIFIDLLINYGCKTPLVPPFDYPSMSLGTSAQDKPF